MRDFLPSMESMLGEEGRLCLGSPLLLVCYLSYDSGVNHITSLFNNREGAMQLCARGNARAHRTWGGPGPNLHPRLIRAQLSWLQTKSLHTSES